MGKKEPREDKFPSNYFETLLKTRLTPKISFFLPKLSLRTSKDLAAFFLLKKFAHSRLPFRFLSDIIRRKYIFEGI